MKIISSFKYLPLLLGISAISHSASADQDTNIRIQQRDALEARQTEQSLLQKELEDSDGSSITVAGETYQVGNTLPELGQALYLAVQSRQWQLVSHFLERYQKFEGFDSLLVHYAKGGLFRSQRAFALAESEFQALLAKQPDFMPAQLELARVLFESHKNSDSYSSFKYIESTLPPDNPRAEGVRNTVESFTRALENREAWQGALSFGPSYNDNLNQSSESYTCLAKLPSGVCLAERSTPDAVSSVGIDFNASLNKRTSISGHHGLQFNGLAYGSSYQNNRQFNDATIIASLGYSYHDANNRFSLSPQLEYSSYGNQALYLASGLKLDWMKTISAVSALKVEVKGEYQDYRPVALEYQSDWQWATYVSYWYQLPSQWLLFGGLDWTQKNNDENVHAYQLVGGRLGVNRAWGNYADVSIFSSYRERKYDAFNALLAEQRADEEQNHTILISANGLSFYGVTPLVSWTHKRVKSNVDWLYTYQQNEFSIKLEKRF